jgi:hypothetical protein
MHALKVRRARAAAALKAKLAREAKAKAAKIALAKKRAAERKRREMLALKRRRALRQQRLHAERKADNTGRCYFGRSAYGGCQVGGKRHGNGGGKRRPKVIKVTKKPTVKKMKVTNSSQCATYCKTKKHCCNDWTLGSNQMVSCAQACEMRIRGVSKQLCVQKVDQFAKKRGQGGCTLVFGKTRVSLC